MIIPHIYSELATPTTLFLCKAESDTEVGGI